MLISKRGKEGDPFNLSNYCHKANLAIAPRRGTAIMWYNHFLDTDGEWLGERDPYLLGTGSASLTVLSYFPLRYSVSRVVIRAV